MNILFMCVENSARSQIAEGLGKKMLGDRYWIESAGSNPTRVNPHAVNVMREIGIDISGHTSKSVDKLSPEFIVGLDLIITLCAEEVCPVIIAQDAKRLHWPIPNPAGKEGTEEQQLQVFRSTRDAIQKKLEEIIQGGFFTNGPVEMVKR